MRFEKVWCSESAIFGQRSEFFYKYSIPHFYSLPFFFFSPFEILVVPMQVHGTTAWKPYKENWAYYLGLQNFWGRMESLE
jgi:hypothetical protein